MIRDKARAYYDGLGIVTSVACAVHCLLLPLCISTLPLLGIDWLENKWVEWTMMAAALSFGILSLYHGYRRHHRKAWPVLLFVTGFCFLVANQVTNERYLPLFILPAAFAIITAHVLNIYHFRRRGKCK